MPRGLFQTGPPLYWTAFPQDWPHALVPEQSKFEALTQISKWRRQSYKSGVSPSEHQAPCGSACGRGRTLALSPGSEPPRHLVKVSGHREGGTQKTHSLSPQTSYSQGPAAHPDFSAPVGVGTHTHTYTYTRVHSHRRIYACTGAHTHSGPSPLPCGRAVNPGPALAEITAQHHRAAVQHGAQRDKSPNGGQATQLSPPAQNPRSPELDHAQRPPSSLR